MGWKCSQPWAQLVLGFSARMTFLREKKSTETEIFCVNNAILVNGWQNGYVLNNGLASPFPRKNLDMKQNP